MADDRRCIVLRKSVSYSNYEWNVSYENLLVKCPEIPQFSLSHPYRCYYVAIALCHCTTTQAIRWSVLYKQSTRNMYDNRLFCILCITRPYGVKVNITTWNAFFLNGLFWMWGLGALNLNLGFEHTSESLLSPGRIYSYIIHWFNVRILWF